MYGANVIIFEGILAFAKKPLIDVSMPYEIMITIKTVVNGSYYSAYLTNLYCTH